MMSASVARHENWSEHQTTMFSSLHEKQKAGKFCDVIVKCKDSEQTFNAHSCVLSAASTVLDKLLQDAMDSSSVGQIEKILLVLPDDIASSCMESLINFIYSGNIDLSQTKPAVLEETARRKSKRSSSSSKTKSSEDGVPGNDSASNNISSLYAFLKASRCLEIHNLTEHLESAVTLSEMKMSELASASRPRRASVSKNQSTLKSGNSDLPSIGIDNSKNGKNKKRKHQIDKKPTESTTVKARSPKKRGSKEEKIAEISDSVSPPTIVVPLPSGSQLLVKDDSIWDAEHHAIMQLQPSMTEIASDEMKSVPPTMLSSDETLYSASLQTNQQKDESVTKNLTQNLEKFTCNTCKLTFKTKSSMNRHACQQPADEQTRRVDSFPVTSRSSKKLQCPTCEKIFTSPSVYELHMKRHISEIEAALAERAKLTSGKPVQQTPTIISETQSDANQATVTEKKPKASEKLIPTMERPPKRASTRKFQAMMKNAFSGHASEHGDTMDSAKRKKRTSPRISATKKMQKKSDFHPTVEKIATLSDTSQQSESATLVIHAMSSTKQAISGQDDAAEENVMFLIPEYGEEYVPLGRMDVAEMITVGSKVSEDGANKVDDSGSFELVESDDELVQQNIFSSEHTELTPHDGEIIPLEDSQPPDGTPLDGADGRETESARKSPEMVKGIVSGALEMCEICGIMVVSKKSHIKVHAAEKLKCEVCGQGFRHKSSLMRHMRYHTSEGQECSVCKQRVFSPQEMQKHMDGHNLKKMRTECPVCKKSFTNQYVMKLHLRSHSGDEKYHCEICQRKFPYKSSLKTHMLLHSGERPYICSVCGKCFVQKIHAREHELQHAGIRRFQCPICNQFFAHKCGMTRHITDVHHKMKPYTCETCGKSFPRKTKLIEHHRMHTGEKPYVCDICGVSYKANRSLKYHKKLRHNVTVKDYEVAIWRNGPLPDEYKSPPKMYPKPSPKKKNKRETSTFAFPVSTATIETPMDKQEEENIFNNIATEVDVISTEAAHPTPLGSPDSTTSKEESPDRTQFHFNTPYQPSQYVTVTETTTYQAPTLPPASTLTKIDPGSVVSGFPPLQGQKTFIVPLCTTVESGQSHVINANQMPGMMVTYMMPSQAMERTELTSVNIAEVSGPAATILERSASVPPMSTFRRPSNVTIPNVTNNAAVTPLPGMHTFTPIQLSAGQLTHPLIAGFSSVPSGLSVFVPATPVMSVAHTTQLAPVQIHEQATEWQTEAYASADA